MRNPSGGAPATRAVLQDHLVVSIDEKPVRRCAGVPPGSITAPVVCPSMRNPSGGAPRTYWKKPCR